MVPAEALGAHLPTVRGTTLSSGRGMMKVGTPVRLKKAVSPKGKRETATITTKLESIEGGVVLDKPLDGFRYWNVNDLEKIEEKSC